MKTMKKSLITLCLAAFFTAAHAQESDTVMATINGQDVTQQEFMTYVSQQAPQANPQNPQVMQQIFEGYIGRELFFQDAISKKLDQSPEVIAKLKDHQRNIIAQALIEKLIADNPISDKAIKEAYEATIAANQTSEYLTRHILLDSKEDADEVISELKKGADFAKLAKEKSTDFSAKDGGNMGWLTPTSMEPAYGEAVKHLKKGGYTTTAVQTDYGWHVIKLDDKKGVQPPALEMVSDNIRMQLQQQLVEQHLQSLRQKAVVEFKK